MDIDRLSSDGLGDLPEDILGSQQTYLKIGGESIGYEASELDRILGQSWAERRDGQTALTPNNDLPGVQEQAREAVDPEKMKAEVVRQARWLIMHNEPKLKVEQHLEGAINDGLLTPVEAAEVLSETLLGRLYLDRTLASKCSDIRKASHHRDARHALYLVMSSDCKECEKQYYGICPQSGKKLIADVPTGKGELRESCQHLAERGRILSNANINDWNDLKLAMAPKNTEIKERVYPYSPPIVEVPPLKVDAVAQDEILKQAGARKEKDNATILDAINSREILPIAQFIGELLLKNGSGINIIKSEVEKRFPDKNRVIAAVEYLKTNVDPALLMTRLAIYPLLFQDCQKTKDFLRANSIKVANVFPVRACRDCRNKINGVCSLIGVNVIEYGISEDEANQAIDELHTVGRLSSAQVRELKDIPDHEQRLAEAVGMAFTQSGERTNNRTGSKHGNQNGLILSAETFANRANAVLWAMEAMSKTATVTAIRDELRKNRDDADHIVCDALASTRTVHANSLDACLDEKYVFASNAELVRAEKCSACPHADQLQCRRHGLVFSLDLEINQTSEVAPEAKEVLDFFEGSALLAEISPKTANKTVEIHFPNEGADLVVDIGKTDSSAVPSYQDLYDILEPIINVDAKKSGAAPLEVDLNGREGYDLSSFL